LKKDDNVGPIILIKADEGARYKDIVSIVDEMAITNIASYAIVDLSKAEKDLLKAQPR
jgi:biopolymer transport protein ExbD